MHEIMEILEQIPDNIKIEWVKGHVKRPRSLQEHLNMRSDKLAEEHRELSQRGGGLADRLPKQPVLVSFGGTSYHGNYESVAKRHYFGTEAEEFIMEKFGIPRTVLDDMDRETIWRVTKNLSLSQQATKVKFTYR